MTKYWLAIIVLGLLGITQPVSAEEGEKEWTGSRIAGAVLILEGVVGLNAYLASLNPRVYGVAGALLFPVAAANSEGKSSDTTRWVGLASVEALAIYNIGLDEDKISDSEIFRNNFIGWHAAAGIMAVTGYFAGDFNRDKKVALNYIAEPHGGRLMLSYRF
jgi:hypothetical protein